MKLRRTTEAGPRRAPSGPQLGARERGGPRSPLVPLGLAALAGALVARVIDWRSHAHPR